MRKINLIRITTVPISLEVLLKGQLKYLNNFYQVIAVSSGGEKLELVREREGVDTRVIEMEREISILKDCRSLFKMINFFRKLKPEIVHSNTPKASLISMIAAWLCNVPHRIYTVTGLRFETATGIKRKILIWMEILTCNCANIVVAESNGVQRILRQNKICKKRTIIIGNGNINGIDEDYWDGLSLDINSNSDIRRKLQIQNSTFVFIFIGRIVPDKGVNELITAFTKIKNQDCKLLIIGEQEESFRFLDADVIKEFKTNNNIISVGYQSDVRQYLAISHALVLPSYREGFPNVILQAGAMGLPCIATKVNGVEDVIDNNNGIIVDKKDFVGLNKAMLYMMENYTTYDREYCRNKIVQEYSQKLFFPKMVEFYEKVIDGNV